MNFHKWTTTLSIILMAISIAVAVYFGIQNSKLNAEIEIKDNVINSFNTNVGTDSYTQGNENVALGYDAKACGEGSIAIGAGSNAGCT